MTQEQKEFLIREAKDGNVDLVIETAYRIAKKEVLEECVSHLRARECHEGANELLRMKQ